MKPDIIFCEVCDKETKHGDVGILPRLKCFYCGEYNIPMTEEKKTETVVDEIMEPAEKVLATLVGFSFEAVHCAETGDHLQGLVGAEELSELVRDLDAALTSIHRNIESVFIEDEHDSSEGDSADDYVGEGVLDCPLCGGRGRIANEFGPDGDVEFEQCQCMSPDFVVPF